MLNALDLEPGMLESNELSKEYQRLGLKRERHLFSLKKDDSISGILKSCLSLFDIEGLPIFDVKPCKNHLKTRIGFYITAG